MSDKSEDPGKGAGPRDRTDRRLRADAQRNIDTLLQTAMAVFATSGVDAPVREIAEKAGVGVGTIYRHFPQRSDLIAAVFRREIDACADAGVLATRARSSSPSTAASAGTCASAAQPPDALKPTTPTPIGDCPPEIVLM